MPPPGSQRGPASSYTAAPGQERGSGWPQCSGRGSIPPGRPRTRPEFFAPMAMMITETAMTRTEIPTGKAEGPGVPSTAVELGSCMAMTSHHRPIRNPIRPRTVSELKIEFTFFGSTFVFTLSFESKSDRAGRSRPARCPYHKIRATEIGAAFTAQCR